MSLTRISTAMLAVLFLSVAALAQPAADDPVAQATKDLSSKDRETVITAMLVLSRAGAGAKDATPELAKLLDSQEQDVAWMAARTIGAIGPDAKAAIPQLQKALGSDNFQLAAYAAYAAGEMGDAAKPLTDDLIKHAFDKDPLVRRAIFRALAKIKPGKEKAIPLFMKAIENSDPELVMPTMRSLASLGKEVVPLMTEVLKKEKGAFWATVVLAEIGPDAADATGALAGVLENEDPEVRSQALMALGAIGPAAKSAVPQIIKTLESDKHESVKYAATFALAKIGDPSGNSAIKAAARSGSGFQKIVSAWALVKLNPKNKRIAALATVVIVNGLKDESKATRLLAARGLVDIDPPADVAAPAFIQALQDADDDVVELALNALASRGADVVPRVRRGLKIPALRTYAVALLFRIGTDASEAAPDVVALLEQLNEEKPADDTDYLRSTAQFALGRIGVPDAAVPVLQKSLSSKDEKTLKSAIYALGKAGPAAKPAVNDLLALLGDKENRELAAWALLKIQPGNEKLAEVAVPMLAEALENGQKYVRIEAAAALAQIKPAAAKPAVPALKKAASDEEEEVAAAAKAALEALGVKMDGNEDGGEKPAVKEEPDAEEAVKEAVKEEAVKEEAVKEKAAGDKDGEEAAPEEEKPAAEKAPAEDA